MDPKDVKLLLKEAKILLRNENGPGALKVARVILRTDDKNYLALISEGYAHQLMKNPQHSLESYKKAIKIDPKSIVAWKGVVDHYEKNGLAFASKNDVLDAYKRLAVALEKDTDATQYIEQTLKFTGVLQSQGDFKQCVKVLGRLIKSRGNNPKIARAMVGVLEQMKNLETEEEQLYMSSLGVLHGSNQASDDHLKKYLPLLFKKEHYEEVKNVCLGLYPRFNTFYQPMEYLCRLYLENRFNAQSSDIDIAIVVEKLFKLYPSSHLGYFAQGKILFENGKYADAIRWFKEGIESRFNDFAAEFLVAAQLQVWDFLGAEEFCHLSLKQKIPPELKAKFKLFLCLALMGQEKFTEAEKMLNEEELGEDDTNLIKAEILAVNDNQDELEVLLNKVTLNHWKLEVFKNWNNPDELYTLCEKCENNFEVVLKCAVRFFKLEDYMNCIHALNLCLNLCPSHPMVQFYISKLHRLEGNVQSAKSYLVYAYESLPISEIGSSLSDLYFEIEEHDANKSLLLGATKKGKKAATKWAWLRLGILNLIMGEANDAVVALHSALMTDHTDCSIWETLADAYFARGSYETSLRAYNKSLDLGAPPIYPKFRIGVVHQHLGEDERAVKILSELGDYNPALVELSKAWLQIAKKMFAEGLDAAVINSIYESIKAAGRALFLTTTTQLILPVKIIAECAIIAAGLNKSLMFKVPAFFVEENGSLDEVVTVDLKDLLLIGIRAISSGLPKATTKSLLSSLEADMAKLYFHLFMKYESAYLQNALHHAKKAVLLESTSFSNWNILGVVAAILSKEKLAQHSFIKSITLNATGNATAWCNLGFLYLRKEEYYLAHRCFNQGQSCEPSYGYSWIGQALAAEILQPVEAMDLYRHACCLEETHIFASLGYADWVCKTLETERTADYIYHIEYLEAVNTSLEKLWWYNVRTPTASALNLQGILQAHTSLVRSAEESFQKSLTLTNNKTLAESINMNLISTVLELKDYKRVLDLVQNLPKQVFRSTAAEALALEKIGENSKSYQKYETLKKFAKTESEISGVLIAQGIVAYKVSGIEDSKTLLFKSCQSSDAAGPAYFALCALSLMNNEQDLAKAVLQEIFTRCTSQKYLHDVAVMHSFYLVSQGLVSPALRSIVTRVHTHPYNGKLRSILASHLINFQSEGGMARSSLLSASFLGEQMDFSGITLTYLLEGDTKNAIKSARQAVHVHRTSGSSWAVLVSSLFARYNSSNDQKDLILALKCANTALTNLVWEETDPIKDWLETFTQAFSLEGK